MANKENPICLEGEEALSLWQGGKDNWNKWVAAHPKADVDFSEVDFSKLRVGDESQIDFFGFIFPVGNVNFWNATFGDGVGFGGATFGNGGVSFIDATFGNGGVNFIGATFGDGSVDFRRANFGHGNVDFRNATFGNGLVDFGGTNFGDGSVSFYNAIFGVGEVYFIGATFGDGSVSFRRANFGGGVLSFYNATFGDGSVDFSDTNFGDGRVDFESTTFGVGEVHFISATFGDGSVDFSNANFGGGSAVFTSMNCEAEFNFTDVCEISNADFRNASFASAVIISNVSFNGILDLVNTKLSHQLSLHNVKFILSRERSRFGFKKAKNTGDAERLNRLKVLAETNKHHQLALRCHADEQRALRWHGMSPMASVLDLVFSGICNYGQSILRPFMIWILSIVAYTGAYTYAYSALSNAYTLTIKNIWQMLIFSAANSLPFVASARGARGEGIDQFFKNQDTLLTFIYPLIMTQGLVSVILLFLIGLGLRNRLRV